MNATRIRRIIFSPFKALISLFRMNYKTRVGVAIFSSFLILGALEPIINYYRLEGKNPLSVGIYPGFLQPTFPELPLGTDPWGRDLFALLLIGVRQTLIIGVVAGVIQIFIAILIGFSAGYKGGLVDHSLRSITDVLLVIPTWPLVIFLALYLKQVDLFGLSFLIAIFGWPGVTRMIRAQVLSVRERPYVELAKASAFGDLEIIFKEIAPNILPYIGVAFANATLGAMLTETGIRFLIGSGLIHVPTLGYLLNLAINQGFLTTRPYALIPPIFFLVFIFISLNLINLGLDEEYNPRLKKVTGM